MSLHFELEVNSYFKPLYLRTECGDMVELSIGRKSCMDNPVSLLGLTVRERH